MGFAYKSIVNVTGRILLYLLKFQSKEDTSLSPNQLTAEAIADAVITNRNNISHYIRLLRSDKLIDRVSTRVKGKKRKQRVYFLTDSGKEKAQKIKNRTEIREISINDSNKKLNKLKFPDVKDYLIKKEFATDINDLELYKFTTFEGILDINKLINKPQDYIDYTADVIKPKYFFGRVNELNQIKNWINDKRQYKVIIIHGIAGIGKTTFASRLIDEYKNKINLFWHSFTDWDTVRTVLSQLIDFLSKIENGDFKYYIDFNKPLDMEQILDLLKRKLVDIKALFIFDDFHKVNPDVRKFFSPIIDILERTQGVKFIFLSRHNIPFYDQQKLLIKNTVGEFEIGGLDYESSTEILQKKQLPKRKFKEIYNITTGHPLLLEIIESDRRARRYIFEEIFSKFGTDDQTIMEVLSVYRLPVSYDALFMDDSVNPESLEDLVQKLIIKEPKDGIYDTHEFIKDFFYKRMNPHKRRKYHRFCADFYIQQNLPGDDLEALYHYIKSMSYKKAIELAIKRSQKIKDQGLSDRFIVELEELSESDLILPQLSDILMLKAQLYFITGNWDSALQHYHRTIEVATEVNKADIVAKAFCEIGYILEEQNLFDDALDNFQRSQKIADKINNNKILAEAKRGIGRCHWRKSDYKKAEKYYNECLQILEDINDFKLIGAIYIDLGNIYFEREKHAQAIRHLEKALFYLNKIDEKLEIARAYNSLGSIYVYSNDSKKAIEFFKKQLEIVEMIGDMKLIGYGLSNIGYCYATLNQTNEAEEYISRARKIYDITKNENILFTIFHCQGLISRYKEDWDDAIDNFNQSMAIIEKLNVPFYLAEILFDFGILYENKSETDIAKKYYKKAYSLYKKNGKSIPEQLEKRMM